MSDFQPQILRLLKRRRKEGEKKSILFHINSFLWFSAGRHFADFTCIRQSISKELNSYRFNLFLFRLTSTNFDAINADYANERNRFVLNE